MRGMPHHAELLPHPRSVEWKKYEMKCRDIEVGTTILMELDPTVVERIMAGVEEQSKEYSKLSSNMGRILTNLTRIQHDNPQPHRQQEPDREPKIKKELCLDILTKGTNPIEFRKFQPDFIVYYYRVLTRWLTCWPLPKLRKRFPRQFYQTLKLF